jgi:aminobutyraldehyde dehydrogenase
LTTLRFMELVADILPAGVLNVVLGTGPDVGAALARHPDIDLVSLTGSVGSGQQVLREAAGTLKVTHLELGGKAPVVVFDDADLDKVVAGIRAGGYYNSGQECGAATRVLCGHSIQDELVERLVASVSTIKVGDPDEDDDVEMGPLVSRAHLERVSAMVARAADDGAVIACGGTAIDRAGFFYPPTLVTRAARGSEITTSEIFGPVVSVETFGSEAEAVQLSNATPYGLAASLWTENVGRALRVSSELDFGTVWVNSHLVLATEMPWGGYGASGHGRELSTLSLEDFSRTKHVMVATGEA